jgi:hypothetical protein
MRAGHARISPVGVIPTHASPASVTYKRSSCLPVTFTYQLDCGIVLHYTAVAELYSVAPDLKHDPTLGSGCLIIDAYLSRKGSATCWRAKL